MNEEERDRALRRLMDKEKIREACLRYTRGLDRHDEDIAQQAYHDGAVDDHGSFIGKAREFIPYVNDVHASLWDLHHHYITNQTIEIDGDTAHAETYYLATLRRKDGTMDIAGGRYIDRFERREGRWAIADRACLNEWMGELVKTSRVRDPDLYVAGAQDRSDPSYQRPLKLSRPHRVVSI